MKNITRSIETVKVWATVLDGDGCPHESKEVFIRGTSFKPTDYRAALKHAGVPLKNNMVIHHETVAQEKYECTVDDFLKVAWRV